MNGVTDYLDKFQCDDNTTSSTADQYRSYLIVNGICYCSSGKNPRAAVRSWSSFKARMCVGLVVLSSEFEPSLELICVCRSHVADVRTWTMILSWCAGILE
jgi:hypothetical protein